MDKFEQRHIGIDSNALTTMLSTLGLQSIDELIDKTIPHNIRNESLKSIPEAKSEYTYLKELKKIASLNEIYHSYIGQGYYGTITPTVILRNIFENPAWYTQYTPYQAEIAQGRLEALLNFQTVITELVGLPIANASLLDEGTAAAEAMAMVHAAWLKKSNSSDNPIFLVEEQVFTQTRDVVLTRANPLGITVKIVKDASKHLSKDVFGVLIQYPGQDGIVKDFKELAESCHEQGAFVVVAADILSLSIFTPPGEWGADVVIGNTQRLGVPMGYGGPHAAYFATTDDFKRNIPGRIIGVSQDVIGNRALRMALQTREQHIRREKATSNICTAQALLAIMAGMYVVYHGPDGLVEIASRISGKANGLSKTLAHLGFEIKQGLIFDTICISADEMMQAKIRDLSRLREVNFGYLPGCILIAIDETCDVNSISEIIAVFEEYQGSKNTTLTDIRFTDSSLGNLGRKSTFLKQNVFHIHRSETSMMRYIKQLESKDLSLVHSMISLGSCTMKLNAASELIPVSWPEFSSIHPFAPTEQTKGYNFIIAELGKYLATITGFEAFSFQPNSGAQGEYAGLLAIRAYHQDRNESNRNVALIPSSAHGTNPASAVMAGMMVIVVKCDEMGNIDLSDLKAKAAIHANNLACLMVTYPSTHGVFEKTIMEACQIIHDNGGLVYMDGANMNAQVGLTSPGYIGADVCHLNLHKTFAIPHGGGGPGMGPICVNSKLQPYLPGHSILNNGNEKSTGAVSSAPYSSASILLISYGYIKMLGAEGLKNSTVFAILNANYIKAKLKNYFPVLYTGENGFVAHELIIDINPFKKVGIQAEDIAKRLMDYGFHAPTMSFPVPGTLMIEPTESENLEELDRFCEAMISIRAEIEEVATGIYPSDNNVLVNAPHTNEMACSDSWDLPYSREKAVYPLSYLRRGLKFWPSVRRVDNAYGDRNLVCTCDPIEDYMQ